MTDDGQTISLVLNGEAYQAPAGTGVLGLIERLGLPAQGVLIEHNGQALLRDEWGSVRLAAGDRLEVLRVVAGG